MIKKISMDILTGRYRNAYSKEKSTDNKRKYLEFKVYPNTPTTIIGWRDTLNYAFQLAGKIV